MNATETITTESKKFLVTAKSFYRIASPQTGEIVANGVLKLLPSRLKEQVCKYQVSERILRF